MGTVVAALGVLATVVWWPFGSKGAEDEVLTDKVTRSLFHVTVTADGELESAGNIDVRCEVESRNSGGTAILRIVPEGTNVKEGDFLLELDSSALELEKQQQQVVVNNSQALVVQAKNTYDTAVIAKQEYLEGVFEQEKQTIQSEIFVSEEDLRRAEEYLQYSKRLAAKGYITPLQLEADAFAVDNAENVLKTAKLKLDVLSNFTKKKMLMQLEADIKTAKARWQAEESSHAVEVAKLDELSEQIDKCIIYAPAAGQVKYAHESDRRGNDEFVVEEGAILRERQVVVRLPDPEKMQVGIKINESQIHLVTEGMPAAISPMSYKGRPLSGTVTRVNEYREPSSRFFGNAKEYGAEVTLDRQQDTDRPVDLRVGKSAVVTIFSRDYPDALTIKVQGVYSHDDTNYAVVRTPTGWEYRIVEIGPNDGVRVLVKSGLEEGELVTLNPKPHLAAAGLLDSPDTSEEGSNAPRDNRPEAEATAASKEKDTPSGERSDDPESDA